MSDIGWIYNGWEPIVRILVVGTLGYLSLVVFLRMTIKRTLAQLNAFDFIITVALGASFGRILTARQVALTEALTAFALLIILQIVLTQLQQRSSRVAQALTASPSLLFYQGQFIEHTMKQQRITRDDLSSAARLKGVGTLAEVEAIVLEPNGKFAIVKKQSTGDGALLDRIEAARP